LKSLFQKLKDQLKLKAIQVSDEELMKPNQLPPHVKRYFMDYVDVYEIMDALHQSDGEIRKAREEQQRDKLFYDMKLQQAIDALKEIRALGSIGSEMSPEAQVADEALRRIIIAD
jgi:hypothetical protein